MTETSNTITSDTVDRIIADVLYRFLEDVESQTIDVGHVTGDNEPQVEFSTTANVVDSTTLDVTLWAEDYTDSPVELGIFRLSIERVI